MQHWQSFVAGMMCSGHAEITGNGRTDLFVQVHYASITLSINSPLHEGNDKPLELVEGLSADLLQMLIHGSCGRHNA